ncbi:MAG: DUF3108 domain-containing protein, partial [Opitutaceae bacterium]|nr:DUF3108 domain-containing protein [Opitutaceae bacterium]
MLPAMIPFFTRCVSLALTLTLVLILVAAAAAAKTVVVTENNTPGNGEMPVERIRSGEEFYFKVKWGP